MKKHSLKTALLIAITIFLSSCAMHTGYMTNSASLSSANFSYTKMNVKGTADAQYFFGFGGLQRSNLVNAAKQNLLSTNPLSDNQALTNITVNFRNEIYLGIYIRTTCLVAGDIVTFNK